MFKRASGLIRPAAAAATRNRLVPTFEIAATAGVKAFEGLLPEIALSTNNLKIIAANYGEALEAAETFSSFTTASAVKFFYEEKAIELPASPSAAPQAASTADIDEPSLAGGVGRYVFYAKNGWSEKQIADHERGLAVGLAPLSEVEKSAQELAKKFSDGALSKEEKSQIACVFCTYHAKKDPAVFANHKIIVNFGDDAVHVRNVGGAPYDVSAVAKKFARESAAMSATKLATGRVAEEILR